ncbi:unnamed protein product [Rotaria sordida]|uniref:Uncharacterized protein n=1 Tax=Rotaria sordida TaxID=392033 RepID=A0A815SX32_9BILA|nr:unnamed protein product [Rotaria sordida]CAF4146913.1 unnamed protein product [Rotaria sordida]
MSTSEQVTDLIREARRTEKLTVSPYRDELLGEHYLQVELIQDSRSIIINIDFFVGYNLSLPQTDELLSVIFDRSKSIYIWRKPDSFLYYNGFNSIYFEHDIRHCTYINIQDSFKIWYNNTYPHADNCNQILDYDNKDGPACSCSYRPLKVPSEEWSLKDAVKYTFKENLDDTNSHLFRCQAITKIATIIDEKWNNEKIQKYLKINHIQQRKINITIEKLNAKLIKTGETTKKKILENLTDFVPLQNYKFYCIDETPKLIQQSISIIINVELFENWQVHSPLIHELFVVVFHRSKTIQLWGKPNQYEYNYEIYELYNTNGILNCHIVYIQDSFKIWYNKTFNHNENCGRILDFEDIDGPLCTRSYRPLKNLNDTWDLKQAIAYTFEERLDPKNFHLYKCLAITKLATVLNEKWSYEKIQDYIKINHLKQKVMFNFI